jgi:hypothetical protein
MSLGVGRTAALSTDNVAGVIIEAIGTILVKGQRLIYDSEVRLD